MQSRLSTLHIVINKNTHMDHHLIYSRINMQISESVGRIYITTNYLKGVKNKVQGWRLMVFSQSTFGCFQETINQSKWSQIKHANTLCYTRKYGEQLTRRNHWEKTSGWPSKMGSKMVGCCWKLQKIMLSFPLFLSLIFVRKMKCILETKGAVFIEVWSEFSR